MNIIVCVKQVPATNEVKMDKETNTIIREGIAGIINPLDMYAIEEALRIKEDKGGRITAISMGIPSTTETLKETLALGVDEAVLLSDVTFKGADSLATSYALSMGVKKIGSYDLIICGKQAADGDTAQVGPSLAEKLNIPHITNVRKIEEIGDDHIRCQRMTEDGFEVIQVGLPALLTVVKGINNPRFASIKGIMKAKKAEINILTASDIGADISKCGLKGSPTQVTKVFIPEQNRQIEIIDGEPREQARKLAAKLIEMNIGMG